MNNKRTTSIVVVTHIPNMMRLKMMRDSIESLLTTTQYHPVEIIVVDNGGGFAVPEYFLNSITKINTYIRNNENMHFGFARNQGIASSIGNYIVIADNDIHYNKGWLQALWKPLEIYPHKKIYTTPIEYPTGVMKEKYDQGKLDVDGIEYNLNMRAGSNCFMIRRKDLFKIGLFKAHRIAGSKWTDEAVNKGYLACVAPGKLAYDLGLRAGYNHGLAVPIKRTLTNEEKVYLNEDEFEIPN